MCGIAGFIDTRCASDAASLAATGNAMAAALRHRGPDDSGVWTDASAGISLAHRRLSILDLSPAGHQPMVSSCGRMVLTYNGEIYNHAELRRELEAGGRRFRGHCDAEVLVEACAEWGVEAALGRLIGMFAFATWDRATHTLVLARDRIGIKPLYWARFGTLFMFGSELKALRAHRGWTPEVDADSLAAFIRDKHVPSPRSIYRGVFKLTPGHLLWLSPAAEPGMRAYWDPSRIAAAAATERPRLSAVEAVDGLETLLRDAVCRRMLADVPLGAFLSGGVDSSTIVALMQAQSTRPIDTYTIGFTEPRYNEAHAARAVATHLGTAHTELYATPEQARDLVPELPRWYDEPFADSSQLPTLLVSELARRHVTVALSGDGGDELFGGYRKYHKARALASLARRLPACVRRAVATGISPILSGAALLHRALPAALRPELSLNRPCELASAFAAASEDELVRQVTGAAGDRARIVLNAQRQQCPQDESLRATLPDLMERLSYIGMTTTLPDGILAKVDRASMAFGLEVRVPLLDHRIVEYVWRLAPSIKFAGAEGNKPLLRRLLYRYVPQELVDRPKRGFTVPIKSWLRGPLREWAEDLLDERRLAREGWFDAALIRSRWRAHVSGSHNHQRLLWCVLMFQQWWQYQAGTGSGARADVRTSRVDAPA